MMGSPPHETNSNHKNRCDLTQIRGIGVVRKRWLNSLGIDTIAALAQTSADAIEAQAKRDGRTLSRDELEEWIAQAQLHCIDASLEQAPFKIVEADASVSDFKHLDQKRTDAEGDYTLMAWDSVASFKVTYQTRQRNGKTEQQFLVHHLEADAVESWSALETDQMQQWMHDRIEALLSPAQTGNAIVASPVKAEITQLRVMQPRSMNRPMVATPNSPIFSAAMQTVEPFALEVSIQFAGPTEVNSQAHVICRVQCLARNLATGKTDSLGEVTTQVALSHHAAHQVLLPSLWLRQPGNYRLQVLVTLPQSPTATGQFKVPMLHVV